METTNPAFEELESLASSNGWVHGLAKRLVGDSHLAEDLAQEAYLRALSTPEKVKQYPTGWFAGVMRNLSRSSARESGRRKDREERSAKSEELNSDPTSDNVARLEQQTLLIQALLGLNEAYRQAVLMRHVDGLPPREIAAQLGVSVATVNSRLTRGLEQLRTKLSSAHGGDRQRWLAAFAPLLQPTVSVSGPTLPFTFGALLMNHKIAAALIATAITLSGWWITSQPSFSWFGSNPSETNSGEIAVLTEDASSTNSLAAAQPETIERNRTVASSQDNAPSQDQDLGTPVLIQVSNAQTGQPLAGAKVYSVDWQRLSETATPQELSHMRSEVPASMRKLFRRRAVGYVTDPQGQVHVPIPEDGVEVFAEHGQLFGNAMVQSEAGSYSLALHLDKPLQVRVVDSQGAALEDIPVMLAGRMGERLLPISTGFTRESGLGKAVLAELAWAPSYGEAMLEAAGDGLVVCLRFPGAGPAMQEIDLEQWPSQPITLESPPLGGVLIRAVQADGSSLYDSEKTGQADSIVHLASNAGGLQLPYLSDPSLLAGATRKGEVLFTPVGLGLDLIAAGWFHSSKTPELLEFKGPRLPSQVVEVDLIVNSTPLLLVGSLFHADGVPLKESQFSMSFGVRGENQHPPLYAETNAQGHFEIEWASDPDQNLQRTYHVQVGGPELLSLTGKLPTQTSAGEMNLGQLILPRSTYLDSVATSGVVLGPDDTPVDNARVHWVTLRDDSEGTQRNWQDIGTMGITDSDGHFRLPPGQPAPGAHLKVDSTDGLYHEPVPVPVASHNLTLRMQAGTNLFGQLLLEEGLSSERISVLLWSQAQGPTPARSDVWGWENARVRERDFRFEGLPPGTYTLWAAAPSDPKPFVLEHIQISGLEELRLPQLNPIDLTGRYRSFSIRTVDESGRSVRAAAYAFEKDNQDGEEVVGGPNYLGHTDRGQFLSVIQREHAFVLSADGFFPVSLDPKQLPRRVVLERGQQVELLWAGETSLAELPFVLKLQLVPELQQKVFGGRKVERYLSRWSPSKTPLGSAAFANEGPSANAKGQAEEAQVSGNHVSVPRPGVYRLVWKTDYEFTEGFHLSHTVELSEAETITATSDSQQSFRVSLSDEVIAKETAWLRQRFEAYQAAGKLPSDLPFGEKYTPKD